MDKPPEISPALASQRDAEANQHLLRGLALLETNTPASLREAVRCFDAAIELRRQLPLAANPWFRYGLIAGWLNRGDALTRLGSPPQLTEALQSYDAALAELRQLPMHESPLFVKRLAIAWLNRGVTLLAYDSPNACAEAAANFAEAIAAAKNFALQSPVEGQELLAGAWLNRGNALIRQAPPAFPAAHAAAKAALTLTAPREQTDPSTAELAFKARHVLCQALAGLLASPESGATARDEFLAEATDTVDHGMALARHWQARGETRFTAAMTELFRFGCRAYQLHQPHFLTEFLLENLDPTHSPDALTANAELHANAMESLWHSLVELQRDGFKTINTPQHEKMLAQLRELRITGARLSELSRALGGK
jgi:hypothetical protein